MTIRPGHPHLPAGRSFRLRHLLDRLFHGTTGELASLTRRLRHEISSAEPEDALAAVVEVVREGLSAAGVAVEVDGTRIASGEAGEVIREVPLIWHGEEVGRLLIGPAAARRSTAHDGQVLTALTPYVADAAHAVRLAADLRRSRERILAAREEERRRLCRDLHDGLGHALTDMAMSINMARISMRTAPASAERLLAELRGGMDAVGQEIRELVYGLRPPTLDELGLAGAVRTLAIEGGLSVVVETEGHLSDLPAAAEVAAYRITQEALTNVRKHAGARSATVSLRRGGSFLTVRISDNGRGLPETFRSGIGLTSMRERAAELGGTCAIGPAPGGGTAVEAVLPITVRRDPALRH
ncbi:sensor histidine kinase [Streptosporangium canum]|uniref:sensor histidine kinase n=1 Tax=Streptosporangium canum TaxID=324952 RepID=UPI00368DA81E